MLFVAQFEMLTRDKPHSKYFSIDISKLYVTETGADPEGV